MNRATLIIIIAAIILLPCSLVAQHKYVGVKICAPCHRTKKQGEQTVIWQKSKHAEAFKVLESDEAKEIAKKMELSDPPAESPECLGCHAPQFDVDAKLITKTFNLEDGVQCETCHGPGSDYKKLSVMKDREKSIAAGMIKASEDPTLCEKCHNEKSPTYKEFDYKKMWAEIKHPVPEAKKAK